MHIITECQNSSDYELLTLEEQDKLFYDLMSVDKRFKRGEWKQMKIENYLSTEYFKRLCMYENKEYIAT